MNLYINNFQPSTENEADDSGNKSRADNQSQDNRNRVNASEENKEEVKKLRTENDCLKKQLEEVQ